MASKTNWDDLENSVNHMLQDLRYFHELIQSSTPLNKEIEKNDLLRILAAKHIAIFLCDTSRGFPHSELILPFVENGLSNDYLEKAFPGYVYGLQHLWSRILGTAEFRGSLLSNIHEVLSDNYEVQHLNEPFEVNPLEEFFNEMQSNPDNWDFSDFHEIELEEDYTSDEKPRDIQIENKWKRLDNYYRRIFDEIVSPKENALRIRLGIDDQMSITGYSKEQLRPLLDPSDISEPLYLTQDDKRSEEKKLDLAMLWYPSNVLEANSIFNGVPLFGNLLLGSSNFAKRVKNGEKVRALIIKHPQGGGKNDYSFAVLITARGSISDSSGWVVAFDCATDYSGAGSSYLEYAKFFIKLSKQNGKVGVNNLTIDKDIFLSYLKKHSVASFFKTIITHKALEHDRNLNVEEFVSSTKGSLFEFLVYKWLNETREGDICKSHVTVGKEEIDIMAQGSGYINLYECKFNSGRITLDDSITQILRKKKELDKIHEKVNPFLVIYNKIPKSLIHQYNLNGISVIDNFREIMNKETIFKGSRLKIMKILNVEF